MPNDPFSRLGIVVLDGGLATELQNRGADLDDRLWSARLLIDQPELIVETHTAYLDAGADVAITASYQASFQGFAERGIDHGRAADLMRRSIALAVQARDAWWDERPRADRVKPLVATSVGPYGAVLANGAEYTGHYGRSVQELRDFHAERLEILADPSEGADVLAVETIPSVLEAEALAQALAEHADRPAWVAFSCRDGGHLCDGTPLDEAVRIVTDAPSVFAVGVNCTAPAHVTSLVRVAVGATDRSILAYPNRGASYDAVTKTWGDADPVDVATLARSWVEAGATMVGGCCGTRPHDIRAIAAVVG
jgi:homocysteine S-methyltransferase